MKRLLFLTYYFPPLNASACVRTWNLARHLSRLGWKVTVVTPESSVLPYLDEDQGLEAKLADEGIRRIVTGHRRRYLTAEARWNQGLGWLVGGAARRLCRFFEVDQQSGWIPASLKACGRMRPGDVDVILATAPPFAAFRVAARLSKRLRCPYVLDYRDPWTGNPHAVRRPSSSICREEKAILSGAAAVSVVSPSWTEALKRRFRVETHIYTVSNGYDPDELLKVAPRSFGHFSIVYTGRFYPPKRSIGPLMAAFRLLDQDPARRNGNWRFHYFGRHTVHVREEARRHDVMDRIELHDVVPWREAVSAVRGAGVSVVISTVEANPDPRDEGIVPAKVFEALGSGVPILAIGPRRSDIARILEKSGGGRIFAGSEVQRMSEYLGDLMNGSIRVPGDASAWSWQRLAQKIDGILDTACAVPPGANPEST